MLGLPFRVMLISDESPDAVERIGRALSRPLPAPVAVQLRMKSKPVVELRGIARELRALTTACGAMLLINDRVDLALEVAADGVHLPRTGLSVACARALLPSRALVGVSCHTQTEVAEAACAGASYALLSPIYAVAGKAPPLGIAGFRSVSAQNLLPLVALGGLGVADASELRAAGAAGIAVLRGVMAAANPARALHGFCAAFGAA